MFSLTIYKNLLLDEAVSLEKETLLNPTLLEASGLVIKYPKSNEPNLLENPDKLCFIKAEKFLKLSKLCSLNIDGCVSFDCLLYVKKQCLFFQ